MDAYYTKIPIIETEHYMLRGVTEADAGLLVDFMGDKETMRYITPHPVQSEEEMLEVIQEQLERFDAKKEIPWVIIHKSSGTLIGQFRLHKLNLWHKKAEMGVVIRRDFQNKGVMTEVLGPVLAFVFDTLDLNRIVGDIFAENRGSETLLKKFGFTKEGTLRQTDFDGEKYHDTIVYSMLKSEYEANK